LSKVVAQPVTQSACPRSVTTAAVFARIASFSFLGSEHTRAVRSYDAGNTRSRARPAHIARGATASVHGCVDDDDDDDDDASSSNARACSRAASDMTDARGERRDECRRRVRRERDSGSTRGRRSA
jgi:hypothetical protein